MKASRLIAAAIASCLLTSIGHAANDKPRIEKLIVFGPRVELRLDTKPDASVTESATIDFAALEIAAPDVNSLDQRGTRHRTEVALANDAGSTS